MRISPIALNSDNYGYIVINELTNECAFVDVSGQPEKMLEELSKLSDLTLKAIFTTHKHFDHAGGNSVIAKVFPDITIYGGVADNVEACTEFVNDGDELTLGENIQVRCIHTPGHTMGHISYFFCEGDHKVVFTGDTLFVGGVGKFFEGTGADMYPSLYSKLAKLPGDTLIYCGHEYTLSNYRFALTIEPENERLIEENSAAIALRAQGKFTIPSSIEKELATNPFMRVHETSIRDKFPGLTNPVDVLTALREAKNQF
mmetsp:Transcript_40789/g.81069  ORF Transcript_40789/g.81069 Transcript_40789/m.81069 type:complete len:258 (+) Transcript_40789:98-871(+)